MERRQLLPTANGRGLASRSNEHQALHPCLFAGRSQPVDGRETIAALLPRLWLR